MCGEARKGGPWQQVSPLSVAENSSSGRSSGIHEQDVCLPLTPPDLCNSAWPP